jgi:hypothetical protein
MSRIIDPQVPCVVCNKLTSMTSEGYTICNQCAIIIEKYMTVISKNDAATMRVIAWLMKKRVGWLQ